MSSCEWLARGSGFPPSLLWGSYEGGGGQGDGEGLWASLWSCPVGMSVFTPYSPELPSLLHLCSTEAGPDFELRLELYGACVEEEGALVGAPKRLATKLSSSLGRSSGKRVRASLDSAGASGSSPILLPTPAAG